MYRMEPIARIRTDFPEKFGIPRQAGLADALRGEIAFEPKYRDANALRGMEEYDRLWLIWAFSESILEEWSPTVKPPRLGGNTRVGVFATRSPFRPNPVGLSSVKLEGVELDTPEGPVLRVSGADMMDGTPIYDIKPYLPFADSHPDDTGGFADPVRAHALQVVFPPQLLAQVPEAAREALMEILSQDPRPSYQEDAARIYHMCLGAYEASFTVAGDTLTVIKIEKK
jgi:tRNA-Thr(GGU) m(6)t(6)A37 methyltransferase TsaA